MLDCTLFTDFLQGIEQAACNILQFHLAYFCQIFISAEDSSLRVFSTVTDLLNKSFGIASYNRKLAKKYKQIDNPVRMDPIIGKANSIASSELPAVICIPITSIVGKKQKTHRQNLCTYHQSNREFIIFELTCLYLFCMEWLLL